MEWEARLFYNWQLCLPADGCNLLRVPNTDSRIFEFVVKTERTNIYRNYNICTLDIVSQPFNPPWLENTECLFLFHASRSLFTNALRNISIFKKCKAGTYRNSPLFSLLTNESVQSILDWSEEMIQFSDFFFFSIHDCWLVLVKKVSWSWSVTFMTIFYSIYGNCLWDNMGCTQLILLDYVHLHC